MNKELWRVVTLKPTLKSFRLMVKRLKYKSEDYHFDLMEMKFIDLRRNLILQVGDSYQYRLPERFEAIC